MWILCLKIFFTRILDVSLGTFRTIVLIKGKNVLAGIIGFFEVFIWFVIVQEALNTPFTSIWVAVFYSLGFASGTIIGAYMTNYFISTPISIQIITSNEDMASLLQDSGFGVSFFKVRGRKEERYMLFVQTTDKRYKYLMHLVTSLDKKAFVVVDETKYVHNGFIIRK